jgi:hypothetical protein
LTSLSGPSTSFSNLYEHFSQVYSNSGMDSPRLKHKRAALWPPGCFVTTDEMGTNAVPLSDVFGTVLWLQLPYLPRVTVSRDP